MTTFRSKTDVLPMVGIITFDSYIGMYAETLRYVSWKLQQLGCAVNRVGCDGVLGACTSLNSLGDRAIDSHLKESICKTCRGSQLNISADFVCNVSNNQSQLKPDAIDFLNRVESTLKKNLAVSAVLEMSYQELPLCRIAFFDFSILLKLSTTSLLSELAISRFMLGLKDVVILSQHFQEYFQRHKLTHIVYINGNYSLNKIVRVLCESKKIICIGIEPQLTSQHALNCILLKQDGFKLAPESILAVEPESIINPKDLRRVLDNFGARIAGDDFNAYTSLGDACKQDESEELIRFFALYPIVHSFFMSSEDELVPHIVTHDFTIKLDVECLVEYKNQFEFTKFYLTEAAKHLNTGFILRLHPRMAINKRDAIESVEHIRYKNLLAEMVLTPNVLILYGDSKVSSYFIVSKSNLVIVAWSTIGLEALLMGVPVVSAFPNALMYPLTKFSNQPQNFSVLKIALFSPSKYGAADDKKLLSWVSVAHEGQFFPTPAPRGQRGKWGRIYSLTYRLIDKIGAYNLFIYIMDLVWFRGTIFSMEVLLTKRVKKISPKEKIVEIILSSYRMRIKEMLDRYEKILFSPAKSGDVNSFRDR